LTNSLSANPANVLVTGASQGIGRAICKEFARRGHAVLGVSRTKPELHDPNQSNLFASLTWASLDLANTDEIGGFASSQAVSSIRTVVLSAVDYGLNGRHSVSTTLPEEWRRVISTNCIGHCILVSQLLPTLLHNAPGVVINISSDVAVLPAPGRAAYAASKAGLHAMVRAVAEEHLGDQLQIYQLIPTFQLLTAGIRRRRPAGHDFSSYGDPAIIARVVTRLADREGPSIPAGAYMVQPDGTIEEYGERAAFPR
jgi:NAD(P)-dependent dehydrogenase (short-subunit alcohol dehydrogenase family)